MWGCEKWGSCCVKKIVLWRTVNTGDLRRRNLPVCVNICSGTFKRSRWDLSDTLSTSRFRHTGSKLGWPVMQLASVAATAAALSLQQKQSTSRYIVVQFVQEHHSKLPVRPSDTASGSGRLTTAASWTPSGGPRGSLLYGCNLAGLRWENILSKRKRNRK